MSVQAIIIAFSGLMLYFVKELPEPTGAVELGPAFFPKLILYFIILLCILQILTITLSNHKQMSAGDSNMGSVMLLIANMIGYVFGLEIIGYQLSTLIFISLLLALLGVRNYKILISVPLVSVLIIFVVFDWMLNVPMP
nr:tripartite tricarboxylate transporter TctB family protein [Caldalkalibacillus salinus]